mmetsp:Transcript_13457/g.18226  ORF Transcript_13457/g.18226 Transcript_13457/m.18226 type:complete len:89 (+) Transcript_13457:710-976(+)
MFRSAMAKPFASPLNIFVTHISLVVMERQLYTEENLPLPKPSSNCQFGTSNETKPKSSTAEVSKPKNICQPCSPPYTEDCSKLNSSPC